MSSSLPSGARLGRYEIKSQLGAGGMGEVYLAQDTKLDRKVALKILPTDVAAHQDRMKRFVQEAKAASALNHPNIITIYEIEQIDSVNFIATEFIDGQTLRERMRKAPVKLGEVLDVAAQIASALSAAHAAGIVHRDLKPDNVMITRDGFAKVLDFGLAQLVEKSGRGILQSGGSDAPTQVMQQHSTPGVVMGNVGYMSPERAQGKKVDQRSDIFSFGCILYEAATGLRPFESDSVIDPLHKILHTPAPLIKDANPSAPIDLQRIVRRCLAKDPDEQYQSIKEVAIELRELRRELEGAAELYTIVPPSNIGSTASSVAGATLPASSPSFPTASPTSAAEYIVSGIKQHKLAALVAVIALAMKLMGAIIVMTVATTVWAQAPPPRVTLEHTAQHSLKSKATGRTYDIMISLPRDYDQSGKKYPVLYVLDGWHFPLMDFIQDNAIYSKRMPPVIMVVIGHGNSPDLMDVRAQDFHAPSLEPNVKSGHADRFLDFFEHQLIPFIDRQYRTVQSDRALLGHSSGGEFAIYALTERPTLFQRIVCVSPYFGPIRDQMFRAVRERLKNLPSPVVLDLSAGTEEDETEGTVALAALLDSIKPAKLRYRLTVFNGENHNSVRLSAFPAGLYWVYR